MQYEFYIFEQEQDIKIFHVSRTFVYHSLQQQQQEIFVTTTCIYIWFYFDLYLTLYVPLGHWEGAAVA